MLGSNALALDHASEVVVKHARIRHAVAIALVALLFAAGANAANYSLIAEAHCDGESTTDVDIAFVSGMDQNPDEGGLSVESYSASASGSGVLSADASSEGVPPFQVCSNRSVARIEETLALPTAPFPDGPVTITAGIAAGTSALSDGGSVANASAQVQLEPFSMNCFAGRSANFGDSGSCPGGSVDGLSVTRTFSLSELGARQWEIDVAAQVDATLEIFSAAGSSNALASGGLYVMVSGGGVQSYTWTGTSTNIPAPEPGASALGGAALGTLAVRARRAARRS